jgi:hypothetical protein
MKTARELIADMHASAAADPTYKTPEMAADLEAWAREIRAEEHEARQALFALERAAHRQELREVRVATLREAAHAIAAWDFPAGIVAGMADRAERGK